MTLTDAKQLKDRFPIETEGFTIFQIDDIWSEHSDSLAASWIIPHREDVERVFSRLK